MNFSSLKVCNLKCPPQLRSNARSTLLSVRIRPQIALRPGNICRCCSSVTSSDTEASPAPAPPARPDSFWQNNAETYQPALSKVEKNEKRADSQRLGKKLCLLIVGRAGITRNTVIALGDALSKNELVKVKAGSACQTDMQSVHDLLTAATDSVCVHSVGYTLTLFRDKSHARPLSSMADLTEAQREQQELQLLTPKQVKGLARRLNRKQKEQEQRTIVEARPSAMRVLSEPSAISAPQSSAAPSGTSNRAAAASSTQHRSDGRPAGARGARGAALVLAACMAAQLVATPVTEAAPLLEMATSVGQHACVLAATNTAILQGIQRQKGAVEYGADGKVMRSGERKVLALQKVQEQLRRVALLTSIGEYDSARMELREGAASSLRKDLRAASEDFEAIKEQMVADAVSSIEALDGALKQRQPTGDVKALALTAAEKLNVVIGGLQASGAAEVFQE